MSGGVFGPRRARMSSLGQRIAEGRTAEIYAWEEGRVLKLFREWVSAEAVEQEARATRAAYAAGLPVPSVGEVREVERRLGIVLGRVEGPSMAERALSKPWGLRRWARLLAELHAEIHSRQRVEGLPAQRDRLRRSIESPVVPPEVRKRALAALEAMPEGEAICHGDFHPHNVIMGRAGPVIIDWIDAACGSPTADVARTWVLLQERAHTAAGIPWWRRRAIRRFCDAYCARYFDLRPARRGQFTEWRAIVAAARLSEEIPGTRKWLLSLAEAGL